MKGGSNPGMPTKRFNMALFLFNLKKMIIKPIKTRVFVEGEDLAEFIAKYIKKLPEKSILVITSKIVSLAQKRIANSKSKDELIKTESQLQIPGKYGVLTSRHGEIMLSAGIDASNADDKLILLPKNSFSSAKTLQTKLKKKLKLRHFGVLITDSRTVPLRAGIIGKAIGYAGFKGLKRYQGAPDIFGRPLKITRTNIADSLASAAVLAMGEANEQKPIAVITNAPVEFTDQVDPKELIISPEEDIYRPIYMQ